MPKQPIYLTISLPKELKELVREWANEDDRSVSYIIRKLVIEEAERRQKEEKTTNSH